MQTPQGSGKRDQILPRYVVQIARDLPSLFILQLQQMPGKIADSLLRTEALGDVLSCSYESSDVARAVFCRESPHFDPLDSALRVNDAKLLVKLVALFEKGKARQDARSVFWVNNLSVGRRVCENRCQGSLTDVLERTTGIHDLQRLGIQQPEDFLDVVGHQAEFLFALPQGLLGAPLLGHVVRNSANHRSGYTRGAETVVVFPNAAFAIFCQHHQSALGGAGLFYVCQVFVKEPVGFQRQELLHRLAQQLFLRVAKNSSWHLIHRQQLTLQIVRADQIVAMLDQVAIAVLTFPHGGLGAPLFGDIRVDNENLLRAAIRAAAQGPTAGNCQRLPVAPLFLKLTLPIPGGFELPHDFM